MEIEKMEEGSHYPSLANFYLENATLKNKLLSESSVVANNIVNGELCTIIVW